MSGRQYDNKEGVPICPNCGHSALRSEETNWNGNWCQNCKSGKFCIEFNEKHPAWIGYKKYKKEYYKQGVLMLMPDTFKTYKEKNGITY